MVSAKKAILPSLVSAVIITIIHGFSHLVGLPWQQVGVAVFIGVFTVAYIGMTNKW